MASTDTIPLPKDFQAIKPNIPDCWTPQPVKVVTAPSP